jgi:hypothetical protein
MYLLRRIWKCKPGEARQVASLVQKQAQIYHDAGQRSEFRVYFNGYTTPTDPDTVVLEWTDEALMSTMRGGHQLPQGANRHGGWRPGPRADRGQSPRDHGAHDTRQDA